MLKMFSFQQRSLATRLAAGFGVMLALVLGIAVTGVAALLHDTRSQARTVQAIGVQQVTRALLLEVTVDDIRTLAIVRSAGMPEVADRFRPDMQASSPRVRQLLKDLAVAGNGVIDPQQQDVLATAHERYLAARDKVLKLVESGQTIEATAAEATVLAPSRDAWRQGVSALAADVDAQAQQSLAQASSLGDLAVRALVVLALMAVATGLLWARAISRSIARPILKAARLSGAIAEGDLIEQPELESGLDREGGEPGVLLRALMMMRSALVNMSRNTAQSAATVSTASESMSLSAQSLAIRTEDQTRSVIAVREQVQQVVQGIQQTALMASAGEQQCVELQAAARSGQEAALQAVRTIEQVAQRSMAMYEVVSLIESIAFQINILSLNAAVEAARAGSAGAGFAVVATEVRTLAKRAADSVHTIRQQIHGAAEHMQSGVQCVNSVERSLHDMLGMVLAVAERARDISTDTHRQTAALALASQGLSQLAELNAANTEMVISTVHGCEALRAEAKQLLERIALMRFHPSEPSAQPAAASPAPATAAEPEFF